MESRVSASIESERSESRGKRVGEKKLERGEKKEL